MATKILYVALGGSAGAVCRFLLSSWVHQRVGMQFPAGTLAANTLGCFLIGFLVTWHTKQLGIDSHLYGLVVIGFLGAFTTFSTFTHETWKLFENGTLLHAGFNIFISLVACFIGLILGVFGGRLINGNTVP